MTPVLELERISVGYGDRVVVNHVSLCVEPGQIVGILGGNGAGKTTVLRAIYGRSKIFEGSIRIAGGEGNSVLAAAERGMGILMQGEVIFPSLTVRENLLIGCRLSRNTLDARLEETLAIFPEVKLLLNKTAAVLSGGERQIVGTCRVLATRPQLLLLDEPGAGLSPALLSRLLQRLRKVARERQIGILLVEQHVAAALDVVDKAVLLRNGEQVFEGPAADLNLERVVRLLLPEQPQSDL